MTFELPVKKCVAVTWLGAAVVGLSVSGVLGRAQPSEATPSTIPVGIEAPRVVTQLDRIIAERFALFSSQLSTPAPGTPFDLRQALALSEMAREYDPGEPRHARLAADLNLQAGNVEGSINALTALRKLSPADQLAQIQLVDMFLSKMETAEQRLGYLQKVIDAPKIQVEVKSHAAVLAFGIMSERGDDSVEKMLDRALELNPQNYGALQTRYQQAARSGDSLARINALLNVLAGSPTDASVLVSLAQECAAIGAYDLSAALYQRGLSAAVAVQTQPPLTDYVDFAGVALMSGKPEDADQIAQIVLKADQNTPELHVIRALASYSSKSGNADADLVSNARDTLTQRIAFSSQLLADPTNTTPPATRPAVAMPDVRADAARLKASGSADVMSLYAASLVDLAWFNLFFDIKDSDPRLLDAIQLLLGDSDPTYARLDGWRLMRAGMKDSARTRLAAVKDDVLAGLGLVLVEHADFSSPEAKPAIEALMASRPSGDAAAFVGSAAKAGGVSATLSDQEKTIAERIVLAVDQNTRFWSSPRNFYLLTARPLSISHAYGQPIFVEVTVRNVSRVPLTIGQSGMLNPRLSVDAEIRSSDQSARNYMSIDLKSAIRLAPRQEIRTIARIDQGQLAVLFSKFPLSSVAMRVLVTSNALQGPRQTQAGPGGQQTTAGQAIERSATPLQIDAVRENAIKLLRQGKPDQKVAIADLLANVLPYLLNAEAQGGREVGAKLLEVVEKQYEEETDELVKVWLDMARSSVLAGSKDEKATADRVSMLKRLVSSSSDAPKVIALIWARDESQANRQSVATAVLESNAGARAMSMAQAVLEMPDPPEPVDPAADAPNSAEPVAPATTR